MQQEAYHAHDQIELDTITRYGVMCVHVCLLAHIHVHVAVNVHTPTH